MAKKMTPAQKKWMEGPITERLIPSRAMARTMLESRWVARTQLGYSGYEYIQTGLGLVALGEQQ